MLSFRSQSSSDDMSMILCYSVLRNSFLFLFFASTFGMSYVRSHGVKLSACISRRYSAKLGSLSYISHSYASFCTVSKHVDVEISFVITGWVSISKDTSLSSSMSSMTFISKITSGIFVFYTSRRGDSSSVTLGPYSATSYFTIASFCFCLMITGVVPMPSSNLCLLERVAAHTRLVPLVVRFTTDYRHCISIYINK